MAMFVIVVCGLISAASLRMLSTTQLSNSFEIQSARAFFAAESGMQREMERLFPLGASASASCAAATGGVSWSMNFASSVDGFKNCSAAITCNDLSADGEIFYRINSIGTCRNASRSLSMTARSVGS